MRRFRELFIGDKAFYKKVLMIAIPVMIQNGITNFVGLLDNIMVGQLGTELMSGVAIANQLVMVFNVCIFGIISAGSIFSAQFFGQGNMEGFKSTFRFKMYTSIFLSIAGILIFLFGGNSLIGLFLTEDGTGNLALAQSCGYEYLLIMLIGLIPYAITQVYASTLRETGETLLPMVGGTVAVFVNLGLNYVLIFGHFGLPKMGVAGAAVATVISRFVEIAIVVIWTHVKSEKFYFMKGVYRSFKVPAEIVVSIIKKGTPLFINEAMWSGGMAVLAQCYSMRGLNAVAAYNISSIVSNLFNVVFIALGSAIAIVVGQLLGAGKLEEAVDVDRKMIFFSVVCCVGIGAIMFCLSPLFPEIYNTSAQVKSIATQLLRISATFMPFYAFYHAAYFTIRSGGKTFITFLFDSCYLWVISIPGAFIVSRYTGLSVVGIFLVSQCLELLKAVVGSILLKKRVWVNNMVTDL